MSMRRIAYNKYGHTDALARLVFFKLMRFGRKSSGHHGNTSPTDDPPETQQQLSLPSFPPSSIVSFGSLQATTASKASDESPANQIPADASLLSTLLEVTAAQDSPSSLKSPWLASPVADGRAGQAKSNNNNFRSKGRATMLAMHKQQTADSSAMYLSAHLLMSAFDHYSEGRGTLSLKQLFQLLKEGGLSPSPLSHDEISKCVEKSCGTDAVSSLSYGSMVRCLRACAHAAFPGGEDQAEDRMIRSLRRSLAHLLYDALESPDSEISELHEQESGVRAPRAHAATAATAALPMHSFHPETQPAMSSSHRAENISISMQGVSMRDKKALEALAAEWTERKINFRKEREKAAAALEKTRLRRLAQNAHKYREQIQGIEAPSLAAHAENNGPDHHGRPRSDRQLAVRPDEHVAYIKGKATRDMEQEEETIEADMERARAALLEETRALEQELMAEMEASFRHLKSKLDAQKKLSKSEPDLKAQVSRNEAPEAKPRMQKPAKIRHEPAQHAPTSYASAVDATANTSRLRGPPAARSFSRSHTPRPAMEELQQKLRQIFSDIFEAFIFLDVHNDHTVHRTQLRRQLSLLHPDVDMEQLMAEIHGDAQDGRLDVIDFAKLFSWHPLGSLQDQHARYLQALKLRRRIVERVHNTLFGGHVHTNVVENSRLAREPKQRDGSGLSRASASVHEDSFGYGKRAMHATFDDMHVPAQHRFASEIGSVGAKTRSSSAPKERPRQRTSTHAGLSPLYERSHAPGPVTSEQRRIAELERQNKMLAEQLQESQRRLAEKRYAHVDRTHAPRTSGRENDVSRSKPVSEEAHSLHANKSKAKASNSHMPEFIGPQGGYKDSDGLSALIRSDDTKTVSQYVSRTGLWLAIPSSKSTARARPYRAGGAQGLRDGSMRSEAGLHADDTWREMHSQNQSGSGDTSANGRERSVRSNSRDSSVEYADGINGSGVLERSRSSGGRVHQDTSGAAQDRARDKLYPHQVREPWLADRDAYEPTLRYDRHDAQAHRYDKDYRAETEPEQDVSTYKNDYSHTKEYGRSDKSGYEVCFGLHDTGPRDSPVSSGNRVPLQNTGSSLLRASPANRDHLHAPGTRASPANRDNTRYAQQVHTSFDDAELPRAHRPARDPISDYGLYQQSASSSSPFLMSGEASYTQGGKFRDTHAGSPQRTSSVPRNMGSSSAYEANIGTNHSPQSQPASQKLEKFKSRVDILSCLCSSDWDGGEVAGPMDTSPHWDVSRETTPVEAALESARLESRIGKNWENEGEAGIVGVQGKYRLCQVVCVSCECVCTCLSAFLGV